jgi:16S rRNA (cytidine1402-2'-O)-methyltransferase
LTKRHEAIYRGSLGEMAALRAADPGAGKGEFTLVVAGAAAAQGPGDAELERVFRLLAGELPPGRAAALAARITGAKRADAYRLASLPGPD